MARLYVGNISFSSAEEDIRKFFAPIDLRRVTICTNRLTGQPRGFAFVDVADLKVAYRAISDLDGQQMGDRRIVVSEAIDKRQQ